YVQSLMATYRCRATLSQRRSHTPMASPLNAVLCALIGTAFWTVLGYAIARHLLPRVLAIGTAPVVGWAVFSAATLPILTLLGFSTRTVVGLAALCLAIAGGWLLQRPPRTA